MGKSYYVIVFLLVLIGLFKIFNVSLAGMLDEIERKRTPVSQAKRARITTDKKSRYAKYKDSMAYTLIVSKKMTWELLINILALLMGAGLFIGSTLDNIALGIALAITLPILFSEWQKLRGASYTRFLDVQVEDSLGIITNHYVQSENLMMAVESGLERMEDPLLSIMTSFLNDMKLGANTVEALNTLRGKINNRYWREWIDLMIRCQDDRQCKSLLLPVIRKMSNVRKSQARLDTKMKAIWSEHITVCLMLVLVVPVIRIMDAEWYRLLMHTPAGKGIIVFAVVDMFLSTLYVLKINKPISQEV